MSEDENLNAVDAKLMSRFDLIADSYDFDRSLSRGGAFLNELELHIINNWVLSGSGSRGLDIACGTGRLTLSLAQRCEKVIAVDISAKMLAIAQEMYYHRGVTNVTFQRVNGRKLSFSENTFDTIICFNFLHLIPNDQKCEFMSEFYRVLKPGGKLIVELKSPFYGLFLTILRYRRRLRSITTKCSFPGWDKWLFRGFRKQRAVGIGFPFFAILARIFGKGPIIKISLAFGKIPFLQYLGYSIIFELFNAKKI